MADVTKTLLLCQSGDVRVVAHMDIMDCQNAEMAVQLPVI